MTITRPGRVLALAMLLALVGAACGGDGNGSSSGDATGATATGASAVTGASGSSGDAGRYGGYGNGDETGATGESGEDPGGSGEDGATVQANNFAFDPSDVEVESGEDLHLRNGNSNTPHTFTVEGTDIDVELAPLAEDEVKVDLDPGTYDFHCRFHADMTGTLTVT